MKANANKFCHKLENRGFLFFNSAQSTGEILYGKSVHMIPINKSMIFLSFHSFVCGFLWQVCATFSVRNHVNIYVHRSLFTDLFSLFYIFLSFRNPQLPLNDIFLLPLVSVSEIISTQQQRARRGNIKRNEKQSKQ
jgi:hypothetical protein